MPEKLYYRTVLMIEILSKDKGPEEAAMKEIADKCDDGVWYGAIVSSAQTAIDQKKMAELLEGQGADPLFLQTFRALSESSS